MMPIGCGISSYFLGDDPPVASSGDSPGDSDHVDSARRSSGSESGAAVLRRTASAPFDLDALEGRLCERHPTLIALRQQLSETLQKGDDSWFPGVRWSDSDSGVSPDRSSAERQMSLDWSPGSYSKEVKEERLRRAKARILSLQIEESQNRLLLQLREDWSDYWYQCEKESLISDSLTQLEIMLDSDGSLFDSSGQSSLEGMLSEWNQRIAQSAEIKLQIQSGINALVGRPIGAGLVTPADPGDVRFNEVETATRGRRHPRELILAESVDLARDEIDILDSGVWSGLVIGAQAHQDQGQPLTASGQNGEAGDWILTVGLEIPLGSDGSHQIDSRRKGSAESDRLELSRVRQKLERQIMECRKRIAASQQEISGYHNSDQRLDIGPLLSLLVNAKSREEMQLQWQRADSMLADEIRYQRSLADRAVGRFQLLELLAMPSAPAVRPQPLTQSISRP